MYHTTFTYQFSSTVFFLFILSFFHDNTLVNLISLEKEYALLLHLPISRYWNLFVAFSKALPISPLCEHLINKSSMKISHLQETLTSIK